MRKIFSFHYYYYYDYYYFKSGKNEAPIKGLPMRNITEVLPNSFFFFKLTQRRTLRCETNYLPHMHTERTTRVKEVGGSLCFDGE